MCALEGIPQSRDIRRPMLDEMHHTDPEEGGLRGNHYCRVTGFGITDSLFPFVSLLHEDRQLVPPECYNVYVYMYTELQDRSLVI